MNVLYKRSPNFVLWAGLPRLGLCCARLFASYSRNNLRALPNSLLGSHVYSQRTLYFVPDLISLLSRILMTFHSCSSTSARPPWPWGWSRAKSLMAVALTEPTVANVLPLWWSSNEMMLRKHKRSKESTIALRFEQWCVFNSFVEQDLLIWVSAVSISDTMFFNSAEVSSSLVLIFSFCITNELSVKCQTPFHIWVKDSRSVSTLTVIINLTRSIWTCDILVVLRRWIVVRFEFKEKFEYRFYSRFLRFFMLLQ